MKKLSNSQRLETTPNLSASIRFRLEQIYSIFQFIELTKIIYLIINLYLSQFLLILKKCHPIIENSIIIVKRRLSSKYFAFYIYIFNIIIKGNILSEIMKGIKIPKGAKLQDHVDFQRYKKQLPGIFNEYYQTNLLDIIDDLPQQPKKPIEPQKKLNLMTERTQGLNTSLNIQNNLINVVLAFKHQCDGLGNDTEINKYQITKAILGKGSHSFVKLAKKQGKTFAIKTISFDRLKKKYYIKDHHIIKMINSQISLLLKLKSPYIIGFEQAIYAPQKQRIFIVLEYCIKGSLLKIINTSGSIPIADWQKKAKKYFIEMAKGLLKSKQLYTLVHENLVIHRDMKSQNVLVNEKDEVKIIDFNISSDIPPNGMITITDKFVGTKTYAPPQLVIPNNNSRDVDGRLVDVWALGVTFLQLYERKHPFNVGSIQQLIKSLQKPVEINKSFQPDLRDLLQRMLHLDNKQRIQVSDILNHPWVRK